MMKFTRRGNLVWTDRMLNPLICKHSVVSEHNTPYFKTTKGLYELVWNLKSIHVVTRIKTILLINRLILLFKLVDPRRIAFPNIPKIPSMSISTKASLTSVPIIIVAALQSRHIIHRGRNVVWRGDPVFWADMLEA